MMYEGRQPLMNLQEGDPMSMPTGYSNAVVERYVMHLIELKGYARNRMKELGDADDVYLWECRVDPDGIPDDVCGDTLFVSWNEYLKKYPERNTDLSFTWEQFYSLPENYRMKVEDYWEYEFSDDIPENSEWLQPVDTESEDMFRFLDDVMMYDWLRKHMPEGEKRDALEAGRNAVRRRLAKRRTVRGA